MTTDRLLYASNWEDPRLELEALAIGRDDVVLATAGGGCTALSLLAEAPRELWAVDVSDAQLRVVALKAAVVRALDADSALAFLDPASGVERLDAWSRVRAYLDDDDRAYWDARSRTLERGVLGEGRADRFLAAVGAFVRRFIHPRERCAALFRCEALDDQVRFYQSTWDTWRWRALFRLLGTRTVNLALGGSFYEHVPGANPAERIRAGVERCLSDLPVRENYFLSRVLLGTFPAGEDGRPPYLRRAGVRAVREHAARMHLRRGDLLAFLERQPDDSIDKFYLSNVPEWLPEARRTRLLAEVARVGRPGAKVAFRALLHERGVPGELRDVMMVDEARSRELGLRDRAFMNASFMLATIDKRSGGRRRDGVA